MISILMNLTTLVLDFAGTLWDILNKPFNTLVQDYLANPDIALPQWLIDTLVTLTSWLTPSLAELIIGNVLLFMLFILGRWFVKTIT